MDAIIIALRDALVAFGAWELNGLLAIMYTAWEHAAALVAAAARPQRVYAVVSRGGRADLAGDALPHVQAPTRLIVGAMDTEVLELNRRARRCLGGRAELCVVPGATHLFEEPGTLAQAAELAAEWFGACLPTG